MQLNLMWVTPLISESLKLYLEILQNSQKSTMGPIK